MHVLKLKNKTLKVEAVEREKNEKEVYRTIKQQ